METIEAPTTKRHLKVLVKKRRSNFMYNGSFYEAISSVILFAQCFALMPVHGIKGKNAMDLKFSWFSFRTIYAVAFLVITIFDTGITFYWFFSQNIEFNNIDTLIFHVSIVIASVNFIQLSRNWPQLMRYWEEIENQLPKYTNNNDRGAMAYKIKMITFVAMMLSLIEHLLNIISIIHSANYCPASKDTFESFFLAQLSQLFYIFNYNPYLAFLGKIHNVLLTFTWNFMDAFVMVISVGLSSHFKQINYSLNKVKGMQIPEQFWAEHRIYYRNMCSLCEQVDNNISVITMLSFSNNLYFICIQLLKSLNKMPSFAHGLYFYFSLIFLIGRTLAVSLYSADINDESKTPKKIFRCIPKESWCPEVKRFSAEVESAVVALSGMRFFHITRKLVLTVAGTIVTYELVLIQFHEDEIVLGCY